MAEDTASISVSIFLGIAAALSLQSFLDYAVFTWIGSSIAAIVFSILLIYLMIDAPKDSYKTASWFKLISIVLVTFFPFALQKALGSYGNKLPIYGLPIHIFLIGLSLVLWTWKDKKLSKDRKIFGRTLGILAILGGIVCGFISLA